MAQARTVLGMISGTSMDGIDLAVLTTDGETVIEPGPVMAAPYAPQTQAALRAALDVAGEILAGGPPDAAPVRAAWQAAGAGVTADHAAALSAFAATYPDIWAQVDLVGFHGQTVLHAPDRRLTIQLGDAAALARTVARPVVGAFRAADVAAGGQGAPFAPLYHQALVAGLRGARGLSSPVAVLNMGGVGNITWLGSGGRILAFDTGPANGPTDDWVHAHTGATMDVDGRLAAAGQIHEDRIAALAGHPYMHRQPPKSLDRLDFTAGVADGLSLQDGAATLTAVSAEAVRLALPHLPEPPVLWIVCGGGRRNPVLMRELAARLPGLVEPAEAAGWRGDDLEAELIAYLAVRSVRGLPLSLPETTGVPAPCPGGLLHEPSGL